MNDMTWTEVGWHAAAGLVVVCFFVSLIETWIRDRRARRGTRR